MHSIIILIPTTGLDYARPYVMKRYGPESSPRFLTEASLYSSFALLFFVFPVTFLLQALMAVVRYFRWLGLIIQMRGMLSLSRRDTLL